MLRRLDRLWQRPKWPNGEEALPIIYLVLDDDVHDPLPALRARLGESPGGPPPHALIHKALDRDDPDEDIDTVLREIVARLADKQPRRHPLRFPHYGLATWLLRLRLPAQTQPDDARRIIAGELKTLLRGRLPHIQNFDLEAAGFPWWIKLTYTLLPKLLLPVMSRTWRPLRWFPEHSPYAQAGNTFYELARSFTLGPRDPEKVDSLLVSAFLEDLHQAYRRTSLWGSGRRRTCYPVLLISCPRADGTRLRLVELLGLLRGQRPRGQRQRRYPLLVLAAGDPPGGESALNGLGEDRPAIAGVALDGWRSGLEARGAPARWFVLFRLSAPGTEENEEQARRKRHAQDEIQQEIAEIPLPRARRPWATYLGAAFAALCLVASVIAVPLVDHHQCRSVLSLPALHADMTREPGYGADQCVGVLPAGAHVPAELADVVKKINENNKVAEGNPDHVTIIHFSMLTPASAQSVRVAREELRGLAIAQKETLSDQYPIRLLLANAGDGMRYADVAAEEIRHRARKDERIMGVVSLGLSTEQTAVAIRLLGNAGVVTVGSATTSDVLVSASSSYFQVSPNNRREAQVAADYAQRQGYRSVRIFYSGDTHDIYSTDLAKYLRTAFGDHRIAVRAVEPYQTDPGGPGTVINLLGASACAANRSAHELVVYAGRAERFNAFLNGIKLSCQDRYPQILADDDVSRFVLAGQNKAYPHLKLDYLALASSALWGKNCAEAKQNYSFYALYDQMFGGACDENKDGRALLNYDALTVLKIAVWNALQTGSRFPPPSNAIVSGLNNIRNRNKVTAASGDIDFGGQDPRVPADKAILILRTTADQPCLVETEGELSKQPHISGDCPDKSG
ncbi:ABC transporter substrate-binding protein [Actinoallomurus iriomotensis]|uniref:Receptor ligand binding region domain-containing protein n=1 Tax=Actinoallomurus iriomotensis TaxID=478107 RepID=A0A9W6RJE1_9ACTN|nr:ABC transporter substrate-binding protein [Actinoallomurus iriomotensis]GLY75122.1 hypothetical protein Airi01_033890 [Actinoallomurus iriomotensis]